MYMILSICMVSTAFPILDPLEYGTSFLYFLKLNRFFSIKFFSVPPEKVYKI